MFQKNISQLIALCLGVLFLSFLINFAVLAWTEPGAAPPSGNVPAPINVGSQEQQKTGALRVTGLLVDYVVGVGGYTGNALLSMSDAARTQNLNGIYLDIKSTSASEGSYLMRARSGGAERFYVGADGYVGIGTNNPFGKLHVEGMAYISDSVLLGDTTKSTGIQARIHGRLDVYQPRPSQHALNIQSGSPSVSRLMVSANGNVGINTTIPQSLLDVRGGVSVGTFSGTYTVPSNGLIVSGNVGVGTTNPTQKLDVNGYVRGSTGLCMGSDCRTSWPAGGAEGISGSGSTNRLAKFTAARTIGNSQIYDNGSNVGIGTTSPRGKLDLAPSGAEGSIFGLDSLVGLNDLRFFTDNTASVERMRINGSGNVGIGTVDPAYKLDVGGITRVRNNLLVTGSGRVGVGVLSPSTKLHVYDSSDSLFTLQRSGGTYPAIFKVGTDNALVLSVGNSDRLKIANNGNVGIGTTSPNQRLDVSGNVRIQDNLYVTDNVGIGTTSPSQKLDVNGQIRVRGGSPTTGKVLASNDNTGVASWKSITELGADDYWSVSGTDLYPNNVAWDLGVGLTSPAAKLHVFSGADEILRLQRSGGGSPVGFNVGTDGNLVLNVGGASRLAITNSGNVGIGTNSPTQRLDVNGQIRIRSGSPGTNKILTSDNTGVGTWKSLTDLGGGEWVEYKVLSVGLADIVTGWTNAVEWGLTFDFSNYPNINTDTPHCWVYCNGHPQCGTARWVDKTPACDPGFTFVGCSVGRFQYDIPNNHYDFAILKSLCTK